MTNSQIDLTSDLVIDMSTPDQMAIATQHDDGYAASRINARVVCLSTVAFFPKVG